MDGNVYSDERCRDRYYSHLTSGRDPSPDSINSIREDFPMAQYMYLSSNPNENDTATTFSTPSDAGRDQHAVPETSTEEPQEGIFQRVADSKNQDVALALGGSHFSPLRPAGARDFHIEGDHGAPSLRARSTGEGYLPSLPNPQARGEEIGNALNGVIEARLATSSTAYRSMKRKAIGDDDSANGNKSADVINGRPSISFAKPCVGPYVAAASLVSSTQVANMHDVAETKDLIDCDNQVVATQSTRGTPARTTMKSAMSPEQLQHYKGAKESGVCVRCQRNKKQKTGGDPCDECARHRRAKRCGAGSPCCYPCISHHAARVPDRG